MNIHIWEKAWSLLDRNERRGAWSVLFIIIMAALSSAAMVGSVMPFLSVLADPKRIERVAALEWAYKQGGFETTYAFLVGLGAASLVVIVVTNFLQIVKTWAVARFAYMRIHTLSHKLLSAYLRQPYEFFLEHHTGEMSTQVLSESQEVVNLFFRPAGDAVASILTVFAIISVLLWVNFTVALIAFTFLGGIYAGTYLVSRRLVKSQGVTRIEANSLRFRLATEALNGAKEIKLLGREQAYIDRYRAPSQRMASAIVAAQVLGEIPQYVMQAVGFGGVIGLSLVLLDPKQLGTDAALGGILPLLGVFAFAGQRLLPELSRLYRSLTYINYSSSVLDAVYRDLHLGDAKVSSYSQQEFQGPVRLKRKLELEDVTYQYPSSDNSGVYEVSFSVRSGEKIGIVGSTGAGKTTLVDLILGLLRPCNGRLKADDIEVNAGNLSAWYQAVGYVPQEIFLTDSTVAENIALGLPPNEINLDRVRRAAKIARIDGFIQKELPQGYDTLVGERGIRLSGGQRQRIGIARALYHDADLIVFDEATSALDNLTEADVIKSIEALPGDKTVIMIAHRLSTVRHCDRILVLDQGKLVGEGKWDYLMQNNQVFQRIASAL